MGSQGGEDSQQGSGLWTQRGGRLWNRADQDAASRPHKVDPAAPHSYIDKLGGMAGEQNRPHNPGLQPGEIKPQTSD